MSCLKHELSKKIVHIQEMEGNSDNYSPQSYNMIYIIVNVVENYWYLIITCAWLIIHNIHYQ